MGQACSRFSASVRWLNGSCPKNASPGTQGQISQLSGQPSLATSSRKLSSSEFSGHYGLSSVKAPGETLSPKIHVHPELQDVTFLVNRVSAYVINEGSGHEALNPVTSVLIRRGPDAQRRSHVKAEARTEGMWPQDQDRLEPLEAGRGSKDQLQLPSSWGRPLHLPWAHVLMAAWSPVAPAPGWKAPAPECPCTSPLPPSAPTPDRADPPACCCFPRYPGVGVDSHEACCLVSHPRANQKENVVFDLSSSISFHISKKVHFAHWMPVERSLF